MANFIAAKVGGWVARQLFTPAQATHLQECILKCPNFSEGSEHALTGPLRISGEGTIFLGSRLVLGNNQEQVVTASPLNCGQHGDLRPYGRSININGDMTISEPGFYHIKSLGGANRNINLPPPGVPENDTATGRFGAWYVFRSSVPTYAAMLHTDGAPIVNVNHQCTVVLVWMADPDAGSSRWHLMQATQDS